MPSKVAIKRVEPDASAAQVTEAVAAAVKDLGGASRFIKRGETVLLKPNLGRPLEPGNPENADWRVVNAVVALAKKAQAGRIVIAEGALGTSTPEAFEKTGVADVARRHRADLVDLNEGEFVKLPVRGGAVLKNVEVAKAVLDADCLINLPALKATIDMSSDAGREYPISMSMKNLKGVLPADARIHFHDVGWQEAVADLNSVMHSDLVVMSALLACVGEGWLERRWEPGVPLGLIIAGDDPVAVDAVAASIVGYDPKTIEHIRLAADRGTGCADLDKIALFTDIPLDDLRAEAVQAVFEVKARTPREKRLPVVVHDFDACTECRVPLFNAINQARSAIRGARRLHVVLGLHPEKVPRVRRCLYIGDCTADLADDHPHVPGCPPSEDDITPVLLKALSE